MNRKAKLILMGVMALIVVIFLLQNLTVVEVQFLFWSLPMSRALFMFLFLLVGLVAGWLLHSIYHNRRSR